VIGNAPYRELAMGHGGWAETGGQEHGTASWAMLEDRSDSGALRSARLQPQAGAGKQEGTAAGRCGAWPYCLGEGAVSVFDQTPQGSVLGERVGEQVAVGDVIGEPVAGREKRSESRCVRSLCR